MPIYLDTQLIKLLENRNEVIEYLKPDCEAIFTWPSFLEFIGLGSLLETFSVFDENNKIFSVLIVTLQLQVSREQLLDLYDKLFAEFLTQVKALPEVNQRFLLEQIHKKKQTKEYARTKELFSSALDKYEKMLNDDPKNIIHDLILYLAWDRLCVNLAILFEYPSTNKFFLNGIEVFKECLIESFAHITGQGKTAPSFFRLAEALYAYQMREERLQLHSEHDWLILCQSAEGLRSRKSLADVPFIDKAVENSNIPSKTFTLDSPEKVKAALKLATYAMRKISNETPEWCYKLIPSEIICLKHFGSGVCVKTNVHQS